MGADLSIPHQPPFDPRWPHCRDEFARQVGLYVILAMRLLDRPPTYDTHTDWNRLRSEIAAVLVWMADICSPEDLSNIRRLVDDLDGQFSRRLRQRSRDCEGDWASSKKPK